MLENGGFTSQQLFAATPIENVLSRCGFRGSDITAVTYAHRELNRYNNGPTAA
jgi:hypothetical protein